MWEQRRDTIEGLYKDITLQLPGIVQYKAEMEEDTYDKICMIQIENADMLVAYAGQESYLATTRDTIEEIKRYLRVHHYDQGITLYMVNQTLFFCAGKKELEEKRFIHIIRKIYKNFEMVKSHITGLAQIARFVLVLNQVDLLQSGLNVLQANKEEQSRFLICDKQMEGSVAYVDELRIIELINYAINTDGVVPFYQGIHNNKTGEINKYEALMRLRDAQGNYHSPYEFMEIAKKYHLYGKLTLLMINRILFDFRHREEMVSINLSIYDVSGVGFRKWFYNKLCTFPDPERIVVELVETESFVDYEGLDAFLEMLRGFGTKIAIDDFGAGYSNLVEIVKIEPDFIKIDGSIVKDVVENEKHLVLIKTICFLAQQLGVSTVAEYVENEQIQRVLQRNGIAYSQGYYFAKPLPIDKLY